MKRRSGFSLMEVLIALAIIAVMMAVMMPALANKLRDSRTTSLAQTFLGFSQGIAEFKRATTSYPSDLTLLTVAPVAASKDICGNAMGATPISLWRGPYVTRVISAGIPMGDALIPTGLRRVTSSTQIFLMVDAGNAESSTVSDLELQFDGSPANATNGTIRWVNTSIPATGTSALVPAPGTGNLNVSYVIPINSC